MFVSLGHTCGMGLRDLCKLKYGTGVIPSFSVLIIVIVFHDK